MKYIKSFICRFRKVNNNKKIIFNKYFNLFEIIYKNKKTNLFNIFKNNNPIIIDIGFGTGNLLNNLSQDNKKYNFIAIDVYLPGIIQCLNNILIKKTCNIKFIYYDAFLVLKNMICNESINIIQLYFPDPWPKNKHKKKRLLNQYFINLIFNRLRNNGLLYIMTDCYDYYCQINNIIHNLHYYNYVILHSNEYNNFYKKNILKYSKTKFWEKAIRNNKTIYIIEYKKYFLIK
ncbi:tRNA (guanosine(46)-N7)-methyltransferase TrmB [Enterobacteriaceae endosymbiont of Neohaemonia nigricornis]|uniref:tRNA (guanosine(46)-N7)-methyltransferase TrmB n=1 Tax=Enterobacteriaceae endosymbiont of Neohaemonia nigricornis TaxID=2675792 RepID=UPI001ABFE49C|nr:tRNA (guanosine(46)-N7)-methyltransferase TrmB [Enterobacteriaceae endosymbiont of Neohaemonia nigricornis]